MKAVFWLGIMFLMQISCLRFKQSRISLLISHIYVLGCFVNFWVIFRYSFSQRISKIDGNRKFGRFVVVLKLEFEIKNW